MQNSIVCVDSIYHAAVFVVTSESRSSGDILYSVVCVPMWLLGGWLCRDCGERFVCTLPMPGPWFQHAMLFCICSASDKLIWGHAALATWLPQAPGKGSSASRHLLHHP